MYGWETGGYVGEGSGLRQVSIYVTRVITPVKPTSCLLDVPRYSVNPLRPVKESPGKRNPALPIVWVIDHLTPGLPRYLQ